MVMTLWRVEPSLLVRGGNENATMILCEPDNAWYANGSQARLCRLPWGAAEVAAKLRIRFSPSFQQPGEWSHAVIRLDGDVLRLASHNDGTVTVEVRGDVQTPGRCLPGLCAALGIPLEALPWVADDLSAKPWLLTRLDENGNHLPMWYFREREAAEAVARDYAARGHKQTYAVERAP